MSFRNVADVGLLFVPTYFIYQIHIQPSMARMHSRKKGKSSSTHPIDRKHPKWGPSPREIEDKIVSMTKEGKSQAMIGIILRDSYGVPDIKTATGKKLSKILEEHGMLPEVPEDLDNLMTKREKLRDHLSANPRDVHNKRELHLIEAKIRRLIKYYRRVGRISDKVSM